MSALRGSQGGRHQAQARTLPAPPPQHVRPAAQHPRRQLPQIPALAAVVHKELMVHRRSLPVSPVASCNSSPAPQSPVLPSRVGQQLPYAVGPRHQRIQSASNSPIAWDCNRRSENPGYRRNPGVLQRADAAKTPDSIKSAGSLSQQLVIQPSQMHNGNNFAGKMQPNMGSQGALPSSNNNAHSQSLQSQPSNHSIRGSHNQNPKSLHTIASVPNMFTNQRKCSMLGTKLADANVMNDFAGISGSLVDLECVEDDRLDDDFYEDYCDDDSWVNDEGNQTAEGSDCEVADCETVAGSSCEDLQNRIRPNPAKKRPPLALVNANEVRHTSSVSQLPLANGVSRQPLVPPAAVKPSTNNFCHSAKSDNNSPSADDFAIAVSLAHGNGLQRPSELDRNTFDSNVVALAMHKQLSAESATDKSLSADGSKPAVPITRPQAVDRVSSKARLLGSPLRTPSTEKLPFFWPSRFPNVPPTVRFVLPTDKVEKPERRVRRFLNWCHNSLTPRVVRKALQASHFTLVDENFFWIGYWGRHISTKCFRKILSFQKINHFAGTFMLGRKDRLWSHIEKACAHHGWLAYRIMPQTYVLPRDHGLLRQQWKTIGENGHRVPEQGNGPLWIVGQFKPYNLSGSPGRNFFCHLEPAHQSLFDDNFLLLKVAFNAASHLKRYWQTAKTVSS